MIAIVGAALALGWLVGIGATGYGIWDAGYFNALSPTLLLGFSVLAVLPAAMILFAALAAREGARGRAEARRLSAAADRMSSPSPAAEAAARKVGVSVRGEIAALDRALDQVVARLREVEGVVARQTLAVDQAVAAAQTGAKQMTQGLERERAELGQIAQDLHEQANLIGEAISRHTRMIADATRMAESEVRAADEALEARLTSFGAAAALISDRTQALNGAAQSSAEAALRLEAILSSALESLAKATTVTDAARQSAEAATQAANVTAGAMRETTARAVDEARRAADMIRSESASIERDAAVALSRLQEAALAAREAALAARSVAEGASQPANAAVGAARAQARSFSAQAAPAARSEPMDRRQPGAPSTPSPGSPGYAESLASPPPAPTPRPAAPPSAPEGARWTWREVLAQIDDVAAEAKAPPEPAPQPPVAQPPIRPPASDPQLDASPRKLDPTRLDFRPPAARREPSASAQPSAPGSGAPAPTRPSEPASSAPGAALVAAAGLRLGEVFAASALERIGQKARGGTQARRRAVREAAPEAVERLAKTLERDDALRQEAAAFLKADGARIAELLGRGRASLSADATRAFLLVDAAAS